MYFDLCKTPEEVKKRYRVLSKMFHPDLGGNLELMQELNKYYKETLDLMEVVDNAMNGKVEDINDFWSIEDYKKKVLDILRWAKSNPKFNQEFMLSMWEKMEDGIDLTAGQRASVDKVYSSFRVEERLKESEKKKTG